MKNIFWGIQAALFYSLTMIAAFLPVALSRRFGALAGSSIPLIVPGRRTIVLDNINGSLPFMRNHPLWDPGCENVSFVADQTFRNMGLSLMEICKLYHGRGDALFDNIELRGREHFDAARARNKGMICFTGHCGNWELMGLAFSRLFGAGSVVARRQNNPFLNLMVEKMRMRYNSQVIYKQNAAKGILKALKNGQIVGILADQAVFPEEGKLIDVLGRKAWASKAPVILAQKSGAPLIPVFIHRDGEKHIITFYPEHIFSGDMSEEGIAKETQALSRYVENFIVAHPTQWYWVHRRWKRANDLN
jgi:Kdo2-lipid IVA lauroyltransferase/acyltransferase